MSYLELLKLGAPEAVVVVGALAVFTLGLTSKHAIAASSAVAALALIAAATAVLWLPGNAALGNGMLVVSPLNKLFQIVCLALALCTVLLARVPRNHAEFLGLLLLGTVGLMLLVGSEELLMIFIGLELTGLSLYVLTAFDQTDLRSAEAGMKYFLFGSTASAFTLFGLSLVYGMTGTTALGAIAQKLASATAPASPLLAAGIVMTLTGFAFKIAAAPFHLWAADTYQGAPTSSAAFVASASKVASFVVLGKILLLGFGPLHGSVAWHAVIAGWTPVIAALAALSIIVGNFVALVQTNVRRLLAYSAVGHAGYTLLGLIAGSREGFSATLFYTTVYAITLLGVFGIVGLVGQETGSDDISNFRGLRSRSPLLAACITVFMLSLAGLPPLAGFFGKFYLFASAFGPNGDFLWLVALALFGSLISLYYYLIILKAVLIDQVNETAPMHIAPLQRGLIALLALAVIFLGVAPQTFLAQILAALA